MSQFTNNTTNSKSFDTDHYPAFESKKQMLRAIRDTINEGRDPEDLLARVALSDLSTFSDDDALTEAQFATALDVQ